MTVKEAAEYLEMEQTTIRQMAQAREMPALKLGGAWRFSRVALGKWRIEQSEVGKGSVLIVDDKDMIRDLIGDVVSRQGYKITTASNGGEALKKLQMQQFDLIFLDLVLPDMSGIDIFQVVKKAGGKETPVVIITGHSDAPIALEALSMNPVFFIRKPFQVNDVVHVLDTITKFSVMSRGASSRA